MISKKLILMGVVLLTMAGFLTAMAGRYWWRSTFAVPVAEAELPGAAAEYRKIIERYHGRDSASDLSGTIRIYDGENKNALKETKTFRCVRSGGQYYMQLSSLQTFCNGAILLQLDTVNKRILICKAVNAGLSGGSPGKDPVEILFSDTARFKMSGMVSPGQRTERVLRLQSDFDPQVRSCRLCYDTLTYSLHNAEIEWWKNGPDSEGLSSDKIWLAKMDYQYHPAGRLNVDERIGEIISISNGKVRLTASYRDYQVTTNFN